MCCFTLNYRCLTHACHRRASVICIGCNFRFCVDNWAVTSQQNYKGQPSCFQMSTALDYCNAVLACLPTSTSLALGAAVVLILKRHDSCLIANNSKSRLQLCLLVYKNLLGHTPRISRTYCCPLPTSWLQQKMLGL